MATLSSEFDNVSTNVQLAVTNRSGLSLPFAINSTGGLKTATGESNDIKIIMAALASHDSEHAFQQPTVAIEAAIFDPHDPTSQAMVRLRLETVFADFENQNRYSLIEESVEFSQDGAGGTFVYFKYHNLESDQIKDMTIGPKVGG